MRRLWWRFLAAWPLVLKRTHQRELKNQAGRYREQFDGLTRPMARLCRCFVRWGGHDTPDLAPERYQVTVEFNSLVFGELDNDIVREELLHIVDGQLRAIAEQRRQKEAG